MASTAHLDPAARLAAARLSLDDLASRLPRLAAPLGAAALLGALLLGLARGDGLRHFGFAYLWAYVYVLSLSLGALFFVPLQHLTRSSWSVVVRRLAEVTAAALPLLAVLALPILLLLPRLYVWADPAAAAGHAELLAHKRPYLNPAFFTARVVFYLLLWSLLARYFHRRSLGQDASADPAVSLRLERASGLTLLAFGLTVTLASFDLLMSLDPTWFSTIFGVYFFAGCAVGFFALLTLLSQGLQRSGRLAGVITTEHYHDLGKLMFAFTFFWAYIAFSQYMLIWYANLPEETSWLLRRQTGPWAGLGLVLIFGHFLLPFLGLVSRYAKRSHAMLRFWAAWLLVVHAADLYWVIMPELSPERIPLHAVDLLCLLGLIGLWIAALARVAGRHPLIPRGDPRLHDSLRFENA